MIGCLFQVLQYLNLTAGIQGCVRYDFLEKGGIHMPGLGSCGWVG